MTVVTVIGCGQEGTSWVTWFSDQGLSVRIFDPDTSAHFTAENITFHKTMSDAVSGAAWIQECVPERLALKQKVLQVVQSHCSTDAIVASASQIFTIKQLQSCAVRSEQILLAHRRTDCIRLLASHRNPNAFVDLAQAFLADAGCDVRTQWSGHLVA
ncbi:3-hydroxyacyl-CoA dehydrogenase NAD-binding domain-containing protein [Parasulfitobacter algicola]|uniref:3-hydroxyacyl-CoA dehydrogenase NAD binding domain-containing protein n=1 Tax=Parasulfitobacter algicola TaxID=2614809 RepID=A0ABX2IPK2_9RHOB|nr:3-hydroxyacyl-CoA dehydrogenase NAD-binding domain-containing protein [Sulfitobacter algicola]NSX53921.1 hypothetical protein [Sulfitobacter algicola]